MALRNQPYIPLYVQDFLTDEKLNMCSLSTQGVYIKLMCILHKQKEYGVILLKQKDKQSESTYLNFANKIAKLLPIGANEIKIAISELVEEDVLIIEGDKLIQKRMVKDNATSESRSKAGKKGGEKTQSKKDFAKAKSEANSEDESESENENTNDSFLEENWRNNFGFYLKELSEKHLELIKDEKFISLQEKYNPNVDIVLSIEKAINNFWGTEAGWKNKKSKRTKVINWESTLTKAIDMNKVYKSRDNGNNQGTEKRIKREEWKTH